MGWRMSCALRFSKLAVRPEEGSDEHAAEYIWV